MVAPFHWLFPANHGSEPARTQAFPEPNADVTVPPEAGSGNISAPGLVGGLQDICSALCFSATAPREVYHWSKGSDEKNASQDLRINALPARERVCLLPGCLCKVKNLFWSKQGLFGRVCDEFCFNMLQKEKACCLWARLMKIWISCPSVCARLSLSLTVTPLFLPAFFPAHAALWLGSAMWIIALSRLSWSYTNNICQLIYHCSPPVVHSRLFICALFLHPCLRGENARYLHNWK